MKIAGIEWDQGNIDKCQKHGVSMAEIDEVLLSPSVCIEPDIFHSDLEERLWAIGKNMKGRSVFIVFTRRMRMEGCWLRPISARYMHQKEVLYYETKTTPPQDR